MAIAVLLLLTPLPSVAGPIESQVGYSHQRTCFKSEYREEYIPGTENNPGYVKSRKETIEVPCKDSQVYHELSPTYKRHVTVYEDVDTNSCVDGSVLGGIVGGGLGGVLSTKDNWIWSIPTGIVGGALLGCQVDGG